MSFSNLYSRFFAVSLAAIGAITISGCDGDGAYVPASINPIMAPGLPDMNSGGGHSGAPKTFESNIVRFTDLVGSTAGFYFYLTANSDGSCVVQDSNHLHIEEACTYVYDETAGTLVLTYATSGYDQKFMNITWSSDDEGLADGAGDDGTTPNGRKWALEHAPEGAIEINL